MILLPNDTSAEIVNRIVAHVGNRVITEFDIQNLDPTVYKNILALKEEAFRKKQMEQFEKEALDYLISQEIIAIAADREGIKVQDAEVDAAIEEIIKRNNIPADKLDEYLEKEGLSLTRYKYQLKKDILNSRVRSQVLMPKIVITEQDIRAIADKKKVDYNLYDKYDVKILLSPDRPSLNTALNTFKKNGSFEETAKQYSIDPSAASGGKLGWLEPELLSEAMKNAIMGAKVGTITKPFEINGQWGVMLVDGFKSKFDFDAETRKKLTDEAADNIFKQVFEVWLERNKNTIVIMKAGQRFEIR